MNSKNTNTSTSSALMTVKEACQEMRLGRTKVYELISVGMLKTVKINRARRIERASMLDLIDRLSSEEPKPTVKQ